MAIHWNKAIPNNNPQWGTVTALALPQNNLRPTELEHQAKRIPGAPWFTYGLYPHFYGMKYG